MADSDDERGGRRSKFARERSDAERPQSRRSARYDDYSQDVGRREKRRYPSPTYGAYRGGGRDVSPPPHLAKRMKRGEHWESLVDFPPGGGGGPGMMMSGPWMGGRDMRSRLPPHYSGRQRMAGGPEGMPPPPPSNVLLSFKQFLAQQSDSIDEVEAVERYAEYKSEFRKKQVEEFFNEHKDEEWFKAKYHPSELKKQKETAEQSLKARLGAFRYLSDNGWFEEGSGALELANQDSVLKIMNAATILMEGGSAHDLTILDDVDVEGRSDGIPKKDPATGEKSADSKPKKKSMDFVPTELTPQQKQLQEQAEKYKKMRLSKEPTSSDEEENPPGVEGEESEERDSSSEDRDDRVQGSDDEQEESNEQDVDEDEKQEVHVQPKPRPLHLTKSVYVKRVPPNVTTADIEQVCRTIPGYIRLAFSDPVPERDYERRCWVTFEHSTNIKDVIARISANLVKGHSLECNVNRDLPRRVKQGSKASYVRRAVVNDIKLAKELIEYYDKKAELWQNRQGQTETTEDGEEEEEEEEEEEGRQDNVNPVLLDVPTGLEEAENEETGKVLDEEEEEVEEEGAIVQDPSDVKEAEPKLLKILDKLLWYLRLVHSVDFYGNSSVPNEDSMPHRCGIITVRNNKPGFTLHQDEVDEYIVSMERNLEVLMKEPEPLSEEEVAKFGQKNYEDEVEKLIERNTQKLSDEKYLCPLSGKKFKAPEYVRKHIFNKHANHVDDVKREVDCYNNYLRDSERPMPDTLATGIPAPTGLGGRMQGPPDMMGWGMPPPGMMFGQGMYPPYGGPGMMGGGGRGGRTHPRGGGPRGRGGGRSTVSYRDLDNPADMDF